MGHYHYAGVLARTIMEKLRLFGSLAINDLIHPTPFVKNSSYEQGP